MRKADWPGFWERQRGRFLLGLLYLAGAVALGRVAVIAQVLNPWQEFCIVFLFSLFLIWAAVATYFGKDRLAPPVSGENIEARLQEWIQKSRFANQKLADSTSYRFAYRLTAPDGQMVVIGRPTVLDNSLRYRTDVTIPERHRRTLNDIGESGRKRFIVEYLAECAKARAHVSSTRALPLTVRIERMLPITRDLNGEHLWATLEGLQQDVIIAVTHVDLCLERLRTLTEAAGATLSASASLSTEAEIWAHSSSPQAQAG
jgi:hypothetical protein